MLAVTGSTGSAGVLTITSKVAGNIGEDVTVKMKLRDTQTSTETCTGATTYTALSGASADPDLTNALAAIQGTEYAFITATLSNADVATVASTNNVNRIDDHIATYNSGLSAKLQQWCIGYTGSISSAVATAADADSGNNSQVGQLVCCVNGRGLPCQLAGREIGGMLKAYSLDPAANRIGELFDGYEGSGDVNADRPTAAESESAIGGGVSLISYTPQGALIMMRPITTHSLDSTGGVDRRLLDIQNVVATYIVARDIRSALPQEFAGAKISPDLEAGDDPLPPGVTEERDIKAFCISRLRFWQRKGVVDRASLDTAVTEGTLIVQVNESDPTQVDIILPFSIVQPLAKMGVVVQRVPN